MNSNNPFITSPMKSVSSTSVEDNRQDYDKFIERLCQMRPGKVYVNNSEVNVNYESPPGTAWLTDLLQQDIIKSCSKSQTVEIERILSVLTQKKESKGNENMDELFPILNLFDSRNALSFFKLPSKNHFYEFTGKPCAIHREKPVFLEFKGLDANQFAGLRQCLEKIVVISSHYGLISTAVAFGCGFQSKVWWFIEYLAETNEKQSEIKISKMSIKGIAEVLVEYCLKKPLEEFYHEHSFAVISASSPLAEEEETETERKRSIN